MPAREGRATLATVAASAGVSVATVSKVVNGRADVGPETRARIQSLLEEHRYVGRRGAAGRVTGRATVELVFEGKLNAYGVEIMQGVLESAVELSVDVAVSLRLSGRRRSAPERPAGSVPERLGSSAQAAGAAGAAEAGPVQAEGAVRDAASAQAARSARDRAAAGRRAVIAVVTHLDPEDLAAFARAHLPLVVIDPLNVARARVSSVGSTNFAGGMAATQHLLELGHRRIAHVGGPVSAACSQARLHGYRAAMEAVHVPVPDGYVRHGTFLYESGVSRGGALLDLPERPTAVFVASDEMAAGVIEAARARGLRIPEDLSVVGFDDTGVARFASPPLTTVRQPLREMGAVALRTALRLAAGEKLDSHHVELATELVVRSSTAPPAVLQS